MFAFLARLKSDFHTVTLLLDFLSSYKNLFSFKEVTDNKIIAKNEPLSMTSVSPIQFPKFDSILH